MSYSNNNEYLYNLPDFQQERIMLIWELQKPDLNLKGPYIKNDNLNIKQSEELPERVLERHRGELPSGTDNEKELIHQEVTPPPPPTMILNLRKTKSSQMV